jgi:hypothetical protein
MAETPACENCGLNHEPDDKASCIEGHGDDPQPYIPGKHGPPVPPVPPTRLWDGS